MYLASVALLLTAPLNIHWLLARPATREVFYYFVTPVAEPSDLAALAVIAAAFVARPRGANATRREPRLFFTWGVLALAVLALVTSPFSIAPPLAYHHALRWLLSGILGWALVKHGPSPRWWAVALLVTLVPQAVIALSQVALQRPLGIPTELMIPPGQPGSPTVVLPDGTHWLRGYGLTFHCNVLGGFLAAGLLLSTATLHHPAALVAWTLLLLGLGSSLSRSAFLGVLCTLPGLVLVLYVRQPQLRSTLRAVAIAFAVTLFAIGIVMAKPIMTRLEPVRDALRRPLATIQRQVSSPEHERIDLMRLALQTAVANPLTGIGAGTFSLSLWRQDAGVTFHPVHNVPLLLAAEVGILAGLVWILGGLVAIWLLVRKWRRLPVSALCGLAAWLAICVIALFDHYGWGILSGRTLTAIVLAATDRGLSLGRTSSHDP